MYNLTSFLFTMAENEVDDGGPPKALEMQSSSNKAIICTPTCAAVGSNFYAVSILPGSSCSEDDVESPLIYTDKKEALRAAKKYKGARFKGFQTREEAILFASQSPQSDVANSSDARSPLFNVQEDTAQVLTGEKPSPFKAPKSQEMVKLRKAIECGDVESFKQTVWSNPRFLVSSGDTPAILQEGFRYNALHVAAKNKQGIMCQVILEVIEDSSFMKLLYSDDKESISQDRTNFLTDLYLNTPEKGFCETPLHFAAKFGCYKAVEVLLSHPSCEINKKNKYGFTAREIVCERCLSANADLKRQIELLFEGQYYVPLLRSDDNSLLPLIGEPQIATELKQSPSLPVSSPTDPTMSVRALAGPMSPSEARLFHKRWKSPASVTKAIDLRKIRLTDCDKGLERVGRELSKLEKVQWTEYWAFLKSWCDLSTTDGLNKLEMHLKKCLENALAEQTSANLSSSCSMIEKSSASAKLDASFPEDVTANSSGLSDICNKLNNFHFSSDSSTDLGKKINGKNEILFSANYDSPKSPLPDLPVNKPRYSKPSHKNNFNKRTAKTKEMENGPLDVFCQKVAGQLSDAFIDLPCFDSVIMDKAVYKAINHAVLPHINYFYRIVKNYEESSLKSAHCSVAAEVASSLKHLLTQPELKQIERYLYSYMRVKLNESSEEDDDLIGSYRLASLSSRKNCIAKEHLHCVLNFMEKYLKDELQQSDVMSCCCVWKNNIVTNGIETHSTLTNGNISDGEPKFPNSYCNGQEKLPELGHCNTSKERLKKAWRKPAYSYSSSHLEGTCSETEDSDDEESNEVFFTPPSSIGSSCSSSSFEAVTPDEGVDVFILGLHPSKWDVDALRVIDKVPIDPVLYPHITRWKATISTFSKESLESFPTPSSRHSSSGLSPLLNSTEFLERRKVSDTSTPLTRRHSATSDSPLSKMEPKNLYDSFNLLAWEENVPENT